MMGSGRGSGGHYLQRSFEGFEVGKLDNPLCTLPSLQFLIIIQSLSRHIQSDITTTAQVEKVVAMGFFKRSDASHSSIDDSL